MLSVFLDLELSQMGELLLHLLLYPLNLLLLLVQRILPVIILLQPLFGNIVSLL